MRVYAITNVHPATGTDTHKANIELRLVVVEDDEEVELATYVGDVDKVEKLDVWHIANRPNSNIPKTNLIGAIEPIVSKSSFCFSKNWDGPFPHHNAYNVKKSSDDIFFPINITNQQLKYIVIPSTHGVSSMRVIFRKGKEWKERVGVRAMPGVNNGYQIKSKKCNSTFKVQPATQGTSRRIVDLYIRPDQYYTRVPFATRLRLSMTSKLRLRANQVDDVFFDAESKLIPSAETYVLKAANEHYMAAVEDESLKEPLHKRICCLLHRLDPDQYLELVLRRYPMLIHVGGCFAGCPSTKLQIGQLMQLARDQSDQMLPNVTNDEIYDDIEMQLMKGVSWQPLDAHMSLNDLMSIIVDANINPADFAISVAKIRGVMSAESLLAKPYIPGPDMAKLATESNNVMQTFLHEQENYLNSAVIPQRVIDAELSGDDDERFNQMVQAFNVTDTAYHSYHYGRIQAMNITSNAAVYDGSDEDVIRYYYAGVLSCNVLDPTGQYILPARQAYSSLSNVGIILSDGSVMDFHQYPYQYTYDVLQTMNQSQAQRMNTMNHGQSQLFMQPQSQSWLPVAYQCQMQQSQVQDQQLHFVVEQPQQSQSWLPEGFNFGRR